MINQLKIRNFLSHKKTQLKFSPGLNIIVGPSDSGKSAIIRALRWVVQNKPSGVEYRSHWGGKTFAKIYTDEGVVTRLKSDSENKYKIDGLELKSFGQGVPTEVGQLLQISDLNLQTQFEKHFLLSSSPGEVAQLFNRVAHLNKIDSGLQNIQRWTRDVSRRIGYNEEEETRIKEELEQFAYLEDAEDVLISLEGIEERINVLTGQGRELKQMTALYSRLSKQVDEELFDAELESLVESLLSTSKMIETNVRQCSEINHIIQKVVKIDEEIYDQQLIAEKEGAVVNLISVFDSIAAAKKELDGVSFALGQINNIDALISKSEKALAKYEQEFHDKFAGTACPVCGGKIK